jgi:4-amino-4-deoxy-L-arabinose transferase-like glycosyltransferase
MMERAALRLTILATATLSAAALLWMLATPFPAYWDEGIYFNNANHDVRAIHAAGWRGFVASFYNEDFSRPPSMRVLALPLTLIAGPSLLLLRTISFGGFLLAALLLAMAVDSVAGTRAAMLAFLLTIESPVLMLAAKMFGTEYPLLIAVAAFLLFEFAPPSGGRDLRWIGIGAALGLGALSKVTFALVGGPMLIAALLLAWRRWPTLPRLSHQFAATGVGALIALTWWWRDWLPALRLISGGRGFLQHSLGDPLSMATFGRWLAALVRCATGYGGAIIIAAAIVAALVAGRRMTGDGRVTGFLIVTISGAVPLLVLQYASGVHNPRHLAPALLVLLAAAPVLASRAGLLDRPLVVGACGALLGLQLIALLTGLRDTVPRSYIWRGAAEVMAPVEQWDLAPVKAVVDTYVAAPLPRIVVLGVGYALNPPQVEAAWIRNGGDALVRSLWRAGRPFDAGAAVRFARTANVLIIAPGFTGDPKDGQPAENVHNDEVSRAVTASGAFDGPFFVSVGVNQPATVAVFVRRPHA